ncbi:hypothetical protein N7470_007737 [Penicillium chermesinum]|nr:hypothetical protein N7470_007737 [Penicillium chermesinum]
MPRHTLRWTTILALISPITAQQIGSIPETHPKLRTYQCSHAHGCVEQNSSLVLDALAHPMHKADNTSVSCTNWKAACASAEECAQACVIEGADYEAHGVRTDGDALTLRNYMPSAEGYEAMSPRVYLLDEAGQEYDLLKLLNREVSFDVDVSDLGCGMNGALYLSEMMQSGGRSELNPAGAQYGTGYCDTQCFHPAWINGVANVQAKGACCAEMDLWEANAEATAFTPHACTKEGLYECAGDECGTGSEGVCDKIGCSWNPYKMGNHRKVVDTASGFTVVTQFVTDDATDEGTLQEVRRLYVQGGKVIQNAAVAIDGRDVVAMTDGFCQAEYPGVFQTMGGLKPIGRALGRGMVLVFSIWNDAADYLNWLDSDTAGPCDSTQGDPDLIKEEHPETSVTFSNVRWGEIDSTYVSS